MPAAIGAALLVPLIGEAAAGATIVSGLTVAGLVGNVVIAGALIGGQLLLNGLNENRTPVEQQQATLNQSVAPRVRVYGRAMVGGTRAFWDARNGQLFQLIMLASDHITSVDEFWIGDRAVSTSAGGLGGNVPDPPFGNNVFYEVRLGADDQTASLTLRDYYPEAWTTAHQLKGIAYAVVVFKGVPRDFFQGIFPQSYNTQLRFVVKGARVYSFAPGQSLYDKSTWTWSENPSDCILDYLRHKDGARFKTARIDLPSFEDCHNIYAEAVERKTDEPEARYRLWGTYNLTETPKTVIPRMLATCDGQLVQLASGKVGMRGGTWKAPVTTIGTRDIVTAEFSQGNDRLDSYNRLNVTFTDPNNYWQPTQMQARDDLSSQAAIGIVDQALDLSMVPSYTQAARLAKIRMGKDNPIWTGSVGTNLAALDALGEPTFDLLYDPIPDVGAIVDAHFYPTAFSLRGDLSGCDIGVASISPALYDWDPETEEPPPPTTPQAIAALRAPTEFTATGGAGNVVLSWRNPNVGNLVGARLWRSASSTFNGTAVSVGFYHDAANTVSNVTDTGRPAGTWYYWVDAVSGVASFPARAGPVSAVVT